MANRVDTVDPARDVNCRMSNDAQVFDGINKLAFDALTDFTKKKLQLNKTFRCMSKYKRKVAWYSVSASTFEMRIKYERPEKERESRKKSTH